LYQIVENIKSVHNLTSFIM